MMNYLRLVSAVALCCILTIGCAQRPIKLATACPKHSVPDLISALTAIVVSEGMNVSLVNEKVGILQASTSPDRSIWTGATTTNQWTFTIKEGRVEATAKSMAVTTNAFGAVTSTSETYYDDKAHTDWKWYWNVRNGLQTLCGDSIQFIQQQ